MRHSYSHPPRTFLARVADFTATFAVSQQTVIPSHNYGASGDFRGRDCRLVYHAPNATTMSFLKCREYTLSTMMDLSEFPSFRSDPSKSLVHLGEQVYVIDSIALMVRM